MWNSIIRALITSYIVFTFQKFKILPSLSFGTSKETILSGLEILQIFIFIALPFVSIIFLKKKKPKLTKLVDKYGSLFLNIKIEKNISDRPLWNITFFFLRRIIVTACTVFFIKQVFIQIWAINIISLGLLVFYIGQQPFTSRFVFNLEVLNELFIYISSFFLMCFTDFVPNPVDRYDIGAIYFYLICSLIVINLVYIVITVSFQAYRDYKKNRAKKLRKAS